MPRFSTAAGLLCLGLLVTWPVGAGTCAAAADCPSETIVEEGCHETGRPEGPALGHQDECHCCCAAAPAAAPRAAGDATDAPPIALALPSMLPALGAPALERDGRPLECAVRGAPPRALLCTLLL